MSGYDGARVLEAIRAINAAQTTQQIISYTVNFTQHYGFSRILIGQLVSPASVSYDDIMFITNYPQELQAERMDMFAVHHDPIAKAALVSTRPFRWEEAMRYATSLGRKVVEMAANYQILDGYTFPIRGLYSIPGGVSFSGEKVDLSPRDLQEVELFAQTVYVKLEELEGPFPYQEVVNLTPRESEVIQFVASGKTSAEIAKILGIQEDTVNKTIQRAGAKLNTTNRAHTVAQAIAKRQIFG